MSQDAKATALPSLLDLAASVNSNGSNNHSANGSGGGSTTSNPDSTNSSALAAAIPLAQLLSNPGALNALTSLSALGGLSDLIGGLATLSGPPVQTTGAHRAKPSMNNRLPRGTGNPFEHQNNSKKFNERNKFNPY